MPPRDWFAVDKEGLARLLARRGRQFAILELLQNGWDEPGVTRVAVSLTPAPGRRSLAALTVTDDAPDGFQDLRAAFTLFAPSKKKADVTKRGRFNLGEKLVLALCEQAEVVSTTGGVRFDQDGRHRLRRTTKQGTVFTALIQFSQADLAATERVVRTLLPPAGIDTVFNGQRLLQRTPVRTFEAVLPTEVADADGYLRPTRRRAMVAIYEPVEGETPTLYELGIPVVETDDRYDVDVRQKIPLNTDRDNVTPAYLRLIRTLVANHTAELITGQDATSTWVREALADDRVEPVVVKRAVTALYGDKAVAYDPSDREANQLAAAKGFVVVPGGTFDKATWRHIRQAGALQPAGKVTPSPKVQLDPDGIPPLPEERCTPGMRRIADYTRHLGMELLGFEPAVRFYDVAGERHAAWWADRTISFNLRRLGRGWFDQPDQTKVDEVLLHEFAHHYGGHLDAAAYEALCRLGARLRSASARLFPQPTTAAAEQHQTASAATGRVGT